MQQYTINFDRGTSNIPEYFSQYNPPPQGKLLLKWGLVIGEIQVNKKKECDLLFQI